MGLLNNFFLVDPLEQFLVLPFFFLGSLGISNLVFTFFLVSFFIILNFKLIKDEPLFVKNYFKFFFISLIDFVKTIAKENVQVKYFIFFPWFLILFLNILFCNLLGMVPYSFTVTSSIITTFYYSLSYFIALNVIGICLHYLQFLLLFLPPGTPAAIIPFLILLEILSYVARVFSLAIRLFANLMSGHTLLHILAGVA
jgi:ATP synthase subunit 6